MVHLPLTSFVSGHPAALSRDLLSFLRANSQVPLCAGEFGVSEGRGGFLAVAWSVAPASMAVILAECHFDDAALLRIQSWFVARCEFAGSIRDMMG